MLTMSNSGMEKRSAPRANGSPPAGPNPEGERGTPTGGSTAALNPRRGAPLPLIFSAALLILLALSAALMSTALWQGALFSIPFLLLGANFGWRATLPLMPAAPLLVYFQGRALDQTAAFPEYAGLLLAAALAALAGQLVFATWRESERHARASERRAHLLQQAAMELNQATSVDALYSNAPVLLSDILSFAHAELIVPHSGQMRVHTSWRWSGHGGYVFPVASISGRAYLTGERQYVPDTRLDPDFVTAPGAKPTLSELALPIKVGGEVRAVLNLEHAELDGFRSEVHGALDAYVRMMEEVLERLEATAALEQSKAEQLTLAELGERLLTADDVREAASAALRVLLPHFDVEFGAFLRLTHGRLEPLATRGSVEAGRSTHGLRGGLPFVGELAEAWGSRRALFLDTVLTPPWLGAEEIRSLAVLPLVSPGGRVQALLLLARTGAVRRWAAWQQRTLERAVTQLAAAFDRATLNRQLLAMLSAIRQLSSSEAPSVLYRRAAEAALELIPGAEAISIQVRQGNLFYYEAAAGWDLQDLQTIAGPFTHTEQLNWYAGSEAAFEAGKARVLRGGAIQDRSGVADAAAERLGRMLSQMMVPIFSGEAVVGILNVDNFSTEEAFDANAITLAESFAQHVAMLVKRVQQMAELERSAVTDTLTGLGNREGFERVVRNKLARARRYEHHLNFVMLDLDNFKRVNDTFGHAVGDVTLKRVAETLRSIKRAADSIFRLGGDEFVLLLPEVQPDAARIAMRRFVNAVATIEVDGIHLGASAGLASYPTDGLEPDALLALADSRMYEEKPVQEGRPREFENGAANGQPA